MKILLAVLYYEPAWAYGGPPKMVSDLARHYARRGHEVTVCTTDAWDAERRLPAGDDVIDGVRVVRFRNASNRLAWRLKILLPLGMRRWLEDNVRKYDIVHLFEARTMQNAWAAQAAVRAGVPFVMSVWGSLPIGSGWRAAIKSRYDRRHFGTLFGRAAALLAQNDHEARLYREYGAPSDRVTVWPLGIDPAEFATLPPRGRLRSRFGISDEAPLVLFVGRINELKGIGALIRSFARCDVADAHLVIVGRDDGFLASAQRLAATERVADRVHFAGPMYGADAVAAYVDCDLFCITPTHFEETSLASLSACACGRAILINDRCGVPWLDDYEAGVCVPHSEAAIAQELNALLSDRERLARLGRNARRMVEERFFLPKIADQAEEIYRSACRREPRVCAS